MNLFYTFSFFIYLLLQYPLNRPNLQDNVGTITNKISNKRKNNIQNYKIGIQKRKTQIKKMYVILNIYIVDIKMFVKKK